MMKGLKKMIRVPKNAEKKKFEILRVANDIYVLTQALI